jgi:hypothetical protein
MKYVLLIVLAAIILRIDFLVRTFDRLSARFGGERPVLTSEESERRVEIVPLPEDPALKSSPRERFFIFMEYFKASPGKEFRDKIVAELGSNPELFGDKLDPRLEGVIFSWRDLILRDEKELPPLLLELQAKLKGENREVIRRFFALLMDTQLETFLTFYSRSADATCLVGTLVADPVPDRERFEILAERERALQAFVQREKVEPRLQDFAHVCVTQVNLQLSKLPPPEAPAPAEESRPAADE